MMGLDAGTLTSVNGLRVNKKMMDLVSKNIARANEPGYARLDPEIGSNVFGNSEIKNVKRITDDWLLSEKQIRDSRLSYYEQRKDFLERSQDLLGAPDVIGTGIHGRNISSIIQKFFSSITKLASHPEDNAQKTSVILEGKLLTEKFSLLGQRFADLRLEADDRIMNAINIINSNLEAIYDINKYRVKITDTEIKANLDIKIDQSLNKIAELCHIDTSRDKYGRVKVVMNGHALLNDKLYKLNYSPMISTEYMLSGYPFNAISLAPVDGSEEAKDIVVASDSPLKKNDFSIGKVKALLELRDNDLLNIHKEIDQLVYKLQSEFNSIYSKGSNFPGKTEVMGSSKVHLTDELKYTGHIKIALLDNNGDPANIPNIGYMKPLTVNLEDIGDAIHPIHISELINEINQYFYIGGNKVTINKDEIDDIRLITVLNSDNIFNFKLEVDNSSKESASIQMLDVDVGYYDTQGNDVFVDAALNSELHNYEHTIPGGELLRSADTVSLDNINVPLNEYFADLTLLINGEEYKFRYNIHKSNGFVGERIKVSSIQGGTGASIKKAGVSGQYISAALVTGSGGVVTKNNTSGYLQIKSNLKQFHLAIDPVDSAERRQEVESGVLKNIFQALELNNFFQESYEVEGSAINMKVVPSVLADHSSFNTGILSSSVHLQTDVRGRFTYQVGAGNNLNVLELARLASKRVEFNDSGNISAHVNDFSGYASYIISDTVTRANLATEEYEREELLKKNIDEKYDAVTGVNIDEEIAKAMMLEQNFIAMSKMIEITDDLYKTVLDSL